MSSCAAAISCSRGREPEEFVTNGAIAEPRTGDTDLAHVSPLRGWATREAFDVPGAYAARLQNAAAARLYGTSLFLRYLRCPENETLCEGDSEVGYSSGRIVKWNIGRES
jgi:hypothetical protein